MDITIIGTGNMSRGIATRALAGGHSATLLGHEAGKAEALANELAETSAPAPSATRSPAMSSYSPSRTPLSTT